MFNHSNRKQIRTEIDTGEWALDIMDLTVLLWRMVVEGFGNFWLENVECLELNEFLREFEGRKI